MMYKKTILENGLLEQYLLGDLDTKESDQIEKLLATDSELKALYSQLEEDFERLGLENSITPPDVVKLELLSAIKESSNRTKVVTIETKRNKSWFLGIAASIALLLFAGSVWMYMQLNDIKEELQIVENEKLELDQKVNTLNQQFSDELALFTTITHPDTEQFILNGNALMPEGKVISYVNHETKSVVVNTELLPKLDDAHDYQMWADVEGEMINMGVITKGANLMAMNYIDHAESLNITVEPLGGNDHPTVERLVTNVYLN